MYARRLATDPHEYAASLLRATNTEMLLVDEGFPAVDIGTSWQSWASWRAAKRGP